MRLLQSMQIYGLKVWIFVGRFDDFVRLLQDVVDPTAKVVISLAGWLLFVGRCLCAQLFVSLCEWFFFFSNLFSL